jgi:DNA-binding winged helix-turn-helix (wHTH) protein
MIYAFNGRNSTICELDTHAFELRLDGRRVSLEPLAFDLLRFLIERHERVVPRTELLERLWSERFVCDAAVNHCVMLARKAVGDDGKSQCIIKTCHRRGYRFVAELREESNTDMQPKENERCFLVEVPTKSSTVRRVRSDAMARLASRATWVQSSRDLDY